MDRVYHKSCSVCKSTEIKSILTLKDHSHTGEKFPVFKCCECGFHFTQNIPDEKFPHANKTKETKKTLIQKKIRSFKLYRKKIKYILKIKYIDLFIGWNKP